ncbi:MAG TPA: hypothetical protein VFZ00_29575 [Solirubrobacter sp.]|nr:hypothetical protein [Solirubrobacter sp.]
MSAATVEPETPRRAPGEQRVMYFVIGAVVVTLAVLGVIIYDSAQDDAQARAKADQLVQEFERAGLPVPADTDQIVATLGDDGGAVCANPANALGKAILADQISNGASFVGRRPVIIDRRFVLGEALILQIYCPEELPAYRELIDKLKYDNTIKP